MNFSVLASGSKGNSSFIETNKTRILVDLGITSGNAEKKLKSLNIEPSSINAIVLTHTHVDHINGIKVFIKKYNPIIYYGMFPRIATINSLQGENTLEGSLKTYMHTFRYADRLMLLQPRLTGIPDPVRR